MRRGDSQALTHITSILETQYATDEKSARKQFQSYLSNPQRWNRYPYALNNPLFYTDPNGEDVTIYYRAVEEGKDVGHILIYVRNDETGESAYFDYVPLDNDSLLHSSPGSAACRRSKSMTNGASGSNSFHRLSRLRTEPAMTNAMPEIVNASTTAVHSFRFRSGAAAIARGT